MGTHEIGCSDLGIRGSGARVSEMFLGRFPAKSVEISRNSGVIRRSPPGKWSTREALRAVPRVLGTRSAGLHQGGTVSREFASKKAGLGGAERSV